MTLTEKLDELRLKHPGCRTLAFADISTSTILYASAEEHLRQEHLDSLCGTAMEMLNGGIATHVRGVFSGHEDSDVYQAIIIEVAEVGVFLKSTTNPADALCCVCSLSIDLGRFVQNARESLTQLGQDT